MDSIELLSATENKTRKIAYAIGKNLRGGEFIELVSDMGGGKTTFVRGLVKGTGSSSHVSSPTFAISKVYKSPKFVFVHYDFYRLESVGLTDYDVEEEINNENSVIVVEWSNVIEHILPEVRLKIEINVLPDESRKLRIIAHKSLDYLLDNLNKN